MNYIIKRVYIYYNSNYYYLELPWILWENEMFSINHEVFDMEHKEIIYMLNSLYYHVISDSPNTIINKTTEYHFYL